MKVSITVPEAVFFACAAVWWGVMWAIRFVAARRYTRRTGDSSLDAWLRGWRDERLGTRRAEEVFYFAILACSVLTCFAMGWCVLAANGF